MKGQCLSPIEATQMLENFHEGLVGRHFNSNINVKKILAFNYWWPIMNKYAIDMC